VCNTISTISALHVFFIKVTAEKSMAASLVTLKQNSRQPSVEVSSKVWEEAEAEQAVVDREDLQEALRQDRGKAEQ